jgi:hypothetical protein
MNEAQRVEITAVLECSLSCRIHTNYLSLMKIIFPSLFNLINSHTNCFFLLFVLLSFINFLFVKIYQYFCNLILQQIHPSFQFHHLVHFGFLFIIY